MVAIDTNVAIAYLKGELLLPVGVQVEDFVLPIVVVGELLFGAHNSGRPEANLPFYRNFIYDFGLLHMDALAAEYYAEDRLALKRKGRPIPENDMWIGAICQAYNVPLLTFDKHFAEIPDLEVLSPS